eukprot:jgi/Psemu1/192661/e_gw1.130.112.1
MVTHQQNHGTCDDCATLLQHEPLDVENQDDGGRTVKKALQEFEHRKQKHPVQQIYGSAALMFGQLVALVATNMNASSYVLEYGMHKIFPMFLLFNSYVILALHLFWSGSGSNGRGEKTRYQLPLTNLKLRRPWYHYLCLSCLDIGPNYLGLLAIHQTSFTSSTLLQSVTIPSAMIFCRILLGKKYRRSHYVGVILCMVGGSITVLMDKGAASSPDMETAHPHSYRGDIIAVIAALGYGLGDACAELWAKHVNREEYLGMIGLFGALWSLVASFLYERDAVIAAFAADDGTFITTVGVIMWYITSLAGYYMVSSAFLMKSDATLLNLSIQTQNFWAVLFSVVVFQEKPSLPFYIAMSLVVTGVFVYELCGNSDTTMRSQMSNSGGNLISESSPMITKSELQ